MNLLRVLLATFYICCSYLKNSTNYCVQLSDETSGLRHFLFLGIFLMSQSPFMCISVSRIASSKLHACGDRTMTQRFLYWKVWKLPAPASYTRFSCKIHQDVQTAICVNASLNIELTTSSPADNEDCLGNGALIRPPSDPEDFLNPADESTALANSDSIDTRGGEALSIPPNGSEEILEPAHESSTISSSISIDSRTSTLKYSQEPFDQYRTRIKELCHIIWPAESRIGTHERRVSGVAKDRILGAVRVKTLRRRWEKSFLRYRL